MNEQKRRMIRGELYQPGDPELTADRLRCRILLEQFNATSATDAGLRHKLLHDLLGHIGGTRDPAAAGVRLRLPDPHRRPYVHQLRRGHPGRGAVTIGDDVQIGPGVQLLTSTHPLEASLRRTGHESAPPITIGFGAWLGGGVIVCPGVTVATRPWSAPARW